jgi:hypothetical protein
MEALLDLLDQLTPPRCRHIHYDVSTREEFFFLLRKWAQKRYRSHPLLYLGFHGKPGALLLGSGKRAPQVTLEEIGEALAGKCNGRVILFGSCETIRAVPWQRRKFLDATQALAICGYHQGGGLDDFGGDGSDRAGGDAGVHVHAHRQQCHRRAHPRAFARPGARAGISHLHAAGGGVTGGAAGWRRSLKIHLPML